MHTARQLDLPVCDDEPLFAVGEDHPNIEWLVRLLEGRDWTKCDDILCAAGKEVGEYGRRWVRRLAQRSKGRVLGMPGQPGYKLTTGCTAAEYRHWRNVMKSQADEMTARVIAADRVFYARAAVCAGHGLLEPGGAETDYAI
jgi:hypothetical protein